MSRVLSNSSYGAGSYGRGGGQQNFPQKPFVKSAYEATKRPATGGNTTNVPGQKSSPAIGPAAPGDGETKQSEWIVPSAGRRLKRADVSRNLMISAIRSPMSEADIRAAFTKFGEIEAVVVYPERRAAVITFASNEGTIECIVTAFIDYEGERLRVRAMVPNEDVREAYHTLEASGWPSDDTGVYQEGAERREKIKAFFEKQDDFKEIRFRGGSCTVRFVSRAGIDKLMTGRPQRVAGLTLKLRRCTSFITQDPLDSQECTSVNVGPITSPADAQFAKASFTHYFSQYGTLGQLTFAQDKAIVNFTDYDSVDKIIMNGLRHNINGKTFRIGRNLPADVVQRLMAEEKEKRDKLIAGEQNRRNNMGVVFTSGFDPSVPLTKSQKRTEERRRQRARLRTAAIERGEDPEEAVAKKMKHSTNREDKKESFFKYQASMAGSFGGGNRFYGGGAGRGQSSMGSSPYAGYATHGMSMLRQPSMMSRPMAPSTPWSAATLGGGMSGFGTGLSRGPMSGMGDPTGAYEASSGEVDFDPSVDANNFAGGHVMGQAQTINSAIMMSHQRPKLPQNADPCSMVKNALTVGGSSKPIDTKAMLEAANVSEETIDILDDNNLMEAGVLCALTSDDFKELNVNLGDRKRIQVVMQTITQFKGN